MKLLYLNIKKDPLLDILKGIKKTEYRKISPYYEKRLAKNYDAIFFRNGYSKNAPYIIIKILGVSIINRMNKKVYAIELGKILETGNLTSKNLIFAPSQLRFCNF